MNRKEKLCLYAKNAHQNMGLILKKLNNLQILGHLKRRKTYEPILFSNSLRIL